MDYRSEAQREPDLERDGHGLNRLEQEESPYQHYDNSPAGEKRHHEEEESNSDASSTFSERHMEGLPHTRSIRRSSTRNSSLSRVPSQRLERATTTASTVLSAVRSRVPRRHKEDPYRPLNWTFRKKCLTTILYGFTAMCATFASSVYSPAAAQIAGEFSIGTEVSTLGISLLLVGFGIGQLLWTPLSEVYGRKLAVLIPFYISAMFAFGGGAAKDVQTLMICRFFQGLFGSAPVTNTGGVLGDIWPPEVRGAAMVGYAMTIVGGPTIGPIVGGAFIVSGVGWRWTQYLTGIMMMFILTLDVIILDESYAPVLLVSKARRLRHESGNWALHAEHEEWDISLVELANKYLVRPFQLLATPICFLMALYASFCYGILYASLAAFPIEFEEERGWNELVGSLPFLAMLVGICIGAFANFFNQKFYISRWKANNFRPVPEARLPPMMGGSIVFAAGLFMFAWSSQPSTPWIVPCIGIALEGIGFFTIFQAALNYLIDTFQRYAASAVAANTALRSAFAAAFPLFISPMLHNMGISWGIAVFGFIAAAMIPIPYFFMSLARGFALEALGVGEVFEIDRFCGCGRYSVLSVCSVRSEDSDTGTTLMLKHVRTASNDCQCS
ncbi:Efflux pump bik6 [Fulvia fulva]|nr:Efflux pump bik6 [Fulvia fulva]